jgi:hypothetical protein
VGATGIPVGTLTGRVTGRGTGTVTDRSMVTELVMAGRCVGRGNT